MTGLHPLLIHLTVFLRKLREINEMRLFFRSIRT